MGAELFHALRCSTEMGAVFRALVVDTVDACEKDIVRRLAAAHVHAALAPQNPPDSDMLRRHLASAQSVDVAHDTPWRIHLVRPDTFPCILAASIPGDLRSLSCAEFTHYLPYPWNAITAILLERVEKMRAAGGTAFQERFRPSLAYGGADKRVYITLTFAAH